MPTTALIRAYKRWQKPRINGTSTVHFTHHDLGSFDFSLFIKETNMSIIRKHTNDRASKIVIHNNTIYLSGQVPADTNLGIQGQTRSTLTKVDDLLAEAGSDREHILSATVYLRDMTDFAAMNEVWNDWVPTGHAPARACVRAEMAREALLVEITIVAALK